MSEQTTIDEAAKAKVRDALLAQARADLEASVEAVEGEHAAAEVVEDATSVDDVSQEDEAGDLAGLFEDAAANQTDKLQQIEGLDFAHRDDVGPGALVGFDGQRFVVGAVASEFTVDGETYEGISADSPLYEQIKGLTVGDTFSVNDATHTIDFVA